MVLDHGAVGLVVEAHHHEVATAGQAEIDMRFDTLTQQADNMMKYKYIVKNIAAPNGKTATFMPKPLFGDNGSRHAHPPEPLERRQTALLRRRLRGPQSRWPCTTSAGSSSTPAPCWPSRTPRPTPTNGWCPATRRPSTSPTPSRNRSAAIRIPMYSTNPKAKRIEFRCPDPSCNPYLAFAAMLMAGLDGIQNKIDPGAPMDKDLYALPPEELKPRSPRCPAPSTRP